jgi:hypothetical protein
MSAIGLPTGSNGSASTPTVPTPRGRGRLKFALELLDLDRLEPEDGDIEPFRAQHLCQLRDFDRQSLAIPSRVLCDLVIDDRQGTLFGWRKSGDDDDRDGLKPEQLGRLEAAMPGVELTVLAHQHRSGEPECDDAVRDLADLLGGMRPRILRIRLDPADRNFLEAHAVFLCVGLDLCAQLNRGIPQPLDCPDVLAVDHRSVAPEFFLASLQVADAVVLAGRADSTLASRQSARSPIAPRVPRDLGGNGTQGSDLACGGRSTPVSRPVSLSAFDSRLGP